MLNRKTKTLLHVLASVVIAVLLARPSGIPLPYFDRFVTMRDWLALIGLAALSYMAILLIRKVVR